MFPRFINKDNIHKESSASDIYFAQCMEIRRRFPVRRVADIKSIFRNENIEKLLAGSGDSVPSLHYYIQSVVGHW